jgi:hypothetical protein
MIDSKLKLYKSVIRPIVTYVSEIWVLKESSIQKKTKTKLRGLSLRANYTDRAAAAGRRS